MDYSIGSIADLITGKNTPNKLKIIAKHIENPQKFEPKVSETSDSDFVSNRPGNKPKKRKVDRNLNDNNDTETEFKRSRVKKKVKIEKSVADPEELARTVFVGNLPVTSTKLQLKKYFKKYGTVETVRLRNVTPSDPSIPKKVALITKQLHPDRKSLTAFVRFSTPIDAQNATVTNGQLFHDHHIRVEICNDERQYDETKAIFVGNLPFDAEEEDLWKVFEPCGDIASIRIIRDSNTGIGKGFAYVNFNSSDSVQLALELEDVKLNDRELRISLCNAKAAKKNRKLNKIKPIKNPGRPKKPRWRKIENANEHGDRANVQNTNREFQGVAISKKKKKRKVSKAFLEKKKLIKQIIGDCEKKKTKHID